MLSVHVTEGMKPKRGAIVLNTPLLRKGTIKNTPTIPHSPNPPYLPRGGAGGPRPYCGLEEKVNRPPHQHFKMLSDPHPSPD